MIVMTMIIGMMAGADYAIIRVSDVWHVLFLEYGHDGDAEDNRGDDRS